ncbi:MAG: Holliday junction branch migration protein RuvA [Christensenellales bacterium]|jgi:Holliday junction DNA helicase RuvA
MYAFLSGRVEYIEADCMAVDCGGVGYLVFCSLSTLAKAKIGSHVKVYTYLSVKDDALTLFGFSDREEKSIFEKLITVSGIGPKVALNVLSRMTPGDLAAAVAAGDAAALKGIPNVGPKLIQRILLELKGKIDPIVFADSAPIQIGGGRLKEAAEALVAIGFTPVEAMRAVSEIDDDKADVSELVRMALKNSYKG